MHDLGVEGLQACKDSTVCWSGRTRSAALLQLYFGFISDEAGGQLALHLKPVLAEG